MSAANNLSCSSVDRKHFITMSKNLYQSPTSSH